MRAAIAGRDTLALMPTGSGKSLTYQLAAMLRPEPTLVLSPLIALMKDQVDKLPPQIAATATFVNSSLSPEETASRLAGVSSGETRLVYAAPERLRQSRFVDLLADVGIGLVVVDEVHCVSMWGHDFRPDYLFIRRGLEALGEPTLLGMTATATPETARDIGASARAHARGRPHERDAPEPALRREPRSPTRRTGSRSSSIGFARCAADRRSSTHARAARPRSSRAFSAATDSAPSTTTPASSRASGRASRTTSSPDERRQSSPRPRSAWASTSPTCGSSASSTTRTRSRGTSRWSVAPGATASRARRSCSRARATRPRLRRFAVSDVPTPAELRAVYRALRDAQRARRA